MRNLFSTQGAVMTQAPPAQLSLASFCETKRFTNKEGLTLFHVKNEEGHWGVFENLSQTMILPCISSNETKEMEYGFWLIYGSNGRCIFNPSNSVQTPWMISSIIQITEDLVLLQPREEQGQVVDLKTKRIYGSLTEAAYTTINLELESHPHRITMITIHKNLLIVGSGVGKIVIVDTDKGEVLPLQHTSSGKRVTASIHNGTIVVSATGDTQMVIDIATNQTISPKYSAK